MNKIDEYNIIKDIKAAKFNIIFGIIFLVWTTFDVATGFFEDFWYANLFFTVLGFVFIWLGVSGLRSAKKISQEMELNDHKKDG